MSKYNKFWAAILMAAGNFVRSYYDIDLGVDEAMATAIVGGVARVLVWVVPNS